MNIYSASRWKWTRLPLVVTGTLLVAQIQLADAQGGQTLGLRTDLLFPAQSNFEGEPAFAVDRADSFNGSIDRAQSPHLPHHPCFGSMPGPPPLAPFFGTLTAGPGGVVCDQDWIRFDDWWTQSWLAAQVRIIVSRPTRIFCHNTSGMITGVLFAEPGAAAPLTFFYGDYSPVILSLVPLESTPGEDTETQYIIYDVSDPPYEYLAMGPRNDTCFGPTTTPVRRLSYGMDLQCHHYGLGEFWYRGDTGAYADNYNPGAASMLGLDMSGPDVVMELYLDGNPLDVHLDAPTWDARCYLISDCGEASASCVAASDAQGDLSFTSQVDGYYWLVVDGVNGSQGPFSIWGMFTHDLDFDLAETMPANDTCGAADAIPRGSFILDGDIGTAHNDYDPGTHGCTGWADTGGDVVWEVEMAFGDSLDVTMTTATDWDDSIYLIRDCNDPVGSCVAGNDVYPDGSHFTYRCWDPGTYYLIVDSYGLGCRGYQLTGFLGAGVSAVGERSDLPQDVCLRGAYPNPFNPRTTIKFELPEAGSVRLSVFDVAGRLVRTLVDESMPLGSHEAIWDGKDASGREVGSGSYLVRLEFGKDVKTTRMGLLR